MYVVAGSRVWTRKVGRGWMGVIFVSGWRSLLLGLIVGHGVATPAKVSQRCCPDYAALEFSSAAHHGRKALRTALLQSIRAARFPLLQVILVP